MAGLVPAIHVFRPTKEVVDGRDKHGHDAEGLLFSLNGALGNAAPARRGGRDAHPLNGERLGNPERVQRG